MSRQPPRLPLDAPKILLVEDSDDVREVVKVLLRAQGADVVAVSTGNEALSAALGADFDVVLRKPIDWPHLFAHLLTAPRRAAA